MKFLPYGRQEIVSQDIEAVTRVLQSPFITQGPMVEAFESCVARYCGADYAVAVNSATSALHLACLALGVTRGDHVWTSPNTFVASANCARLCGAEIGFVDIDPRTYNLCANALEEKLRITSAQGLPMPKVVVVVHFAGQSCDMDAIANLSDQYGFRIIEDASHAIGARYKEQPVGQCQYSDITVFSFHPVKIITSGEGGIALCNQPRLHERMALLRTHGVQKSSCTQAAPSEPWVYQQDALGLNYRMTDIQAALGVSQMSRLDDYVQARHALASRYDQLLQPLDVTLPFQHADNYSSFHLYPVLVGQSGQGGAGRRNLYTHFHQHGIGVNVHYIPVHTQPYYQAQGHRHGDCPNAEAYYERTISLPIFGSMTFSEQDWVVDVMTDQLTQPLAA